MGASNVYSVKARVPQKPKFDKKARSQVPGFGTNYDEW